VNELREFAKDKGGSRVDSINKEKKGTRREEALRERERERERERQRERRESKLHQDDCTSLKKRWGL
jgi:hypothetical protein